MHCLGSLDAVVKHHTGEWEEANLETPRSETPSCCGLNCPSGRRLWTQADGSNKHRVVMYHCGLN